MDWHLDSLLNLPNVTVETCTQEAEQVFLQIDLLNAAATCPHCQTRSEKIHQNRPILVRDLAIFGRPVYLQVPRRQFYCRQCQHYFTERLEFVDWERRYTQRYEEYVYQRVQASNIEQVGREESLSWDQVNGIFTYKFNLKKSELGTSKALMH
ncbi:transposase family protein [Trichothermofontia sichuanensis B231]|uniref:transposase family protein n=1 Tax=Trichothermofontia sichuanensis TaxID=3045816 RepID=UPI00224724B5|nr:transposase family protein [Trichothermofontia sichuanensis]UZQ53878.1 transposase family protein [Trichothermofontia sichuanensis B231]